MKECINCHSLLENDCVQCPKCGLRFRKFSNILNENINRNASETTSFKEVDNLIDSAFNRSKIMEELASDEANKNNSLVSGKSEKTALSNITKEEAIDNYKRQNNHWKRIDRILGFIFIIFGVLIFFLIYELIDKFISPDNAQYYIYTEVAILTLFEVWIFNKIRKLSKRGICPYCGKWVVSESNRLDYGQMYECHHCGGVLQEKHELLDWDKINKKGD